MEIMRAMNVRVMRNMGYEIPTQPNGEVDHQALMELRQLRNSGKDLGFKDEDMARMSPKALKEAVEAGRPAGDLGIQGDSRRRPDEPSESLDRRFENDSRDQKRPPQ